MSIGDSKLLSREEFFKKQQAALEERRGNVPFVAIKNIANFAVLIVAMPIGR